MITWSNSWKLEGVWPDSLEGIRHRTRSPPTSSQFQPISQWNRPPHVNTQRTSVAKELSVNDGRPHLKSTHICLQSSHRFNPADLCWPLSLFHTDNVFSSCVAVTAKCASSVNREAIALGEIMFSSRFHREDDKFKLSTTSKETERTPSSCHVPSFNIQHEAPKCLYVPHKFVLWRNMKVVRSVLNIPPWHFDVVKCSSLRKLKSETLLWIFKRGKEQTWSVIHGTYCFTFITRRWWCCHTFQILSCILHTAKPWDY